LEIGRIARGGIAVKDVPAHRLAALGIAVVANGYGNRHGPNRVVSRKQGGTESFEE